jgi:hypothetical protein
MNTEQELNQRLEKLAYRKSHPFCYHCYRRAPSGTCELCQSDDLMRELAGEGVEYGVEWIIKSLLRADLTPVKSEEAFEQSVSECYPETVKVGWLELDTVRVLKEMDPVSWDVARGEWESAEADNGQIVSFDNGSTYYWTHEVEAYLDEEESNTEDAA